LFNILTGEVKITGQGLFTTLSTTTRAIQLDSNKALINDTVGFVSKLPAYMIDAFKSTLDELRYANLILLVLDASESINEIERKYASSLDVINEFEVPPSRIVYVLNKVDATNAEEAFDKAGKLGILDTKSVVPVSAKTGFNIDQLRSIIRTRLFEETATEQEQVESAAVTAEEPEA
jgi:GTP-binding protein HflX